MYHAKDSTLPDQKNLDIKQRKKQAELIMQLFVLWKLTYKQQTIALGLSPNTQTSIANYKAGHPLPSYRDLQDRVGHLLAIHKLLRRAYPSNKELAYVWIHTPNSDFNNATPFSVIEHDGYLGLFRIRKYLERNQI